MPDYRQELRFGVFITPVAGQAHDVVELAKLAELVGLDLVSFQDHPYQPRFLDTWTLLSVVAAETSTITVAPNVANLPLRPPAVLARSVASLDILSGGRVELGLGAGAFWEGIEALGGERLTPGQSVDALSEAIEVIRAMWAGERSATVEGEHHRLEGAKAGPPPGHAVEIWLGAYKPRMLRLTGAKADGWLPSHSYLELEDLPKMSETIDDAATKAGRDPAEIRRLFNVDESFGAEQLAELTLTTGMSTFILAADSEEAVRRFGEEVAPAVRELVERGRSTGAARIAERSEPPAPAASTFRVTPTPDDGTRFSSEQPWDESPRPRGPAADPERRYTDSEQAAGQHLIDVHDGLRAEMARIRDLIDQVEKGTLDPAAVRTLINRMTIRQNNWTLGAYCASYCRTVGQHHTLEDTGIFPHLRQSDERLDPVISRLEEEHEAIAELLDRIDASLVAVVASEDDAMTRLRAAMDLLTDAMLSHLSYEERELVEPLSRLGFY